MRKINNKKWYRPREIAKLGLIKNSRSTDNVDSNYNFILAQIRNGNLDAKNYGGGSVSYWIVSEDAINEYHKGAKS